VPARPGFIGKPGWVRAFDGITVAASKDLVVAVSALDIEAEDVAAIVFGKTDSRVIFVAGTMFVRLAPLRRRP
jgi:hypothetical protein